MNQKFSNIFKGDRVIWMVFFFLCIISVIEVFSASSELTYKSGSYFQPMIKHIAILSLGVFLTVVTLNIKCKYFKIATPLFLIISFLILYIAIPTQWLQVALKKYRSKRGLPPLLY